MKAVRGRSEVNNNKPQRSANEKHDFLIHEKGDHIGVVTKSIKSGNNVMGVYMDSGEEIELHANGDIPLGHKIALVNLPKGSDVLKYSVKVGETTQKWEKGDYVHTHNIKTARW